MNLNADGSPVAYPGEFIRVIIGSTIHGLNVAGMDDLDLMGVCLETPEQMMGLGKQFEQHVWRTQPEGVPSGVGDVDLTSYGLRKFLRLAAKGNPTIINLLFVPESGRHIDGALGDELRALTPQIISREAAARYRGYLLSQKERLMGVRGQKHTGYTRRLKYMAGAGWDQKYASHMIRLGVQGVELLETGHISLPMQEPLRSAVRAIRQDEVSLEDCIAWAERLEAKLEKLADESDLPEHPDREALNQWLIRTYLTAWNTSNPVS